jgi:hypothetical protein
VFRSKQKREKKVRQMHTKEDLKLLTSIHVHFKIGKEFLSRSGETRREHVISAKEVSSFRSERGERYALMRKKD